MTLILVTPPAAEPVALADAKTFLRIDHDDEDALVGTLIAAARLHVEAAIRRVLVTQSWRLVLDGWPASRTVEIPLSPVASIDAVTIYDGAGDPTVLEASAYAADVSSFPARLLIRDSVSPGAAFNGVEIDFTAGYGDPADVPAPLTQAILQLVAHWYETREPVAFGGPVSEVPSTVVALIAPYRAVSL
jgi:uncharacterized phiE125 gp8 family phage protein